MHTSLSPQLWNLNLLNFYQYFQFSIYNRFNYTFQRVYMFLQMLAHSPETEQKTSWSLLWWVPTCLHTLPHQSAESCWSIHTGRQRWWCRIWKEKRNKDVYFDGVFFFPFFFKMYTLMWRDPRETTYMAIPRNPFNGATPHITPRITAIICRSQ